VFAMTRRSVPLCLVDFSIKVLGHLHVARRVVNITITTHHIDANPKIGLRNA
jgi:hypothetical protein